ncbi:hypothetical protein Ahy_B07g088305 [Arachis hypogaea]|uniref:Uncharacterized protein n=1 Tax=Arachis hypogaea TaxID=3818 RepID=A0A444YE51_ARAHY|nr:hypothetical protein Ahy_B07g088305 [Arachis hypogaea]
MLFADITTGRGVVNQPSGRGRGSVSCGTLGNSGSSPSTLTTPVTSSVAGASGESFIMVPNPNYVLTSTATTSPPSAQQPNVSMTLSQVTDATPKSSHRSDPANVPPPPPILNFIWDKEDDPIIRKIYDHGMGRRLQQMREDIREKCDHLISWLRPKIKKALYVHWETDEGFKYRRLITRANRASTRSSKYTGGSAMFMKTKDRLSKSLDRDATSSKTFKYTHALKENKKRFTYQRSADHYESYTQRLEAATQ